MYLKTEAQLKQELSEVWSMLTTERARAEAAEKDAARYKQLLNACKMAMQHSMACSGPMATDWAYMIAAIDAAMTAPPSPQSRA